MNHGTLREVYLCCCKRQDLSGKLSKNKMRFDIAPWMTLTQKTQ